MEKYNAVIRLPGVTWTGLLEAETRSKAAIIAVHRMKEETRCDYGVALLLPLVSLSKVHPKNRKTTYSLENLFGAFSQEVK